MIEGRLKLDQWEDKQSGQKRSRLGVVMESFQFLDSGSNRGDDNYGGDGGNSDAPQHPAPHTKRSSQPQGGVAWKMILTLLSDFKTWRFFRS